MRFFFRRLVVLIEVDTLDATDRETIEDAWLGVCFLNKKSKLGRINSFFFLDIPAAILVLCWLRRLLCRLSPPPSLNYQRRGN